MKKLFNSAFIYLVVALISGVLFREFTKILGVTDTTALGKVHGHLLTLGFMMFLIFLVLDKCFKLSEAKNFNLFFILYHIGLVVSVASMLTRGITSVLEINGSLTLSNGLDAAISGISGLGHIILTIGLVLFMFILKKQIENQKA
ncbi:DUF2871 domain-containing protein [Bacillus massiliigorillae]|uniref:DUF2871 domain-containing protein n=1 Tax=Bacillus massiliigorillae TaxID=1243664 RepID=UPI0003AA6EE8|nr:DUF2871 domain-containing protein [Bacillus massiliigorillae]